ncbi:MAG: hypothetical protein ACSHXY_05895 [Alphaproteobacteria bacterium]
MTAVFKPGSAAETPRMVRHINAATLWALPEWSQAPLSLSEQLAALSKRGVCGVQHPMPDHVPVGLMPIIGQARIDIVTDAARIASNHKSAGFQATTLHVGTELESDNQIDTLIGSVIEASTQYNYPLFVETHRATATQDIRRTLEMIDRFPDIRINADLSHWYTGHEMTYGDIDAKFDAMQPVFERVRYMHGRIGTACCAQVRLDSSSDDRPFVEHFREMWRRCAAGFLKTAEIGEVLPFAPELLPHSLHTPSGEMQFYYARTFKYEGGEREESDRWEQAGILWDIAEECAASEGLAVVHFV